MYNHLLDTFLMVADKGSYAKAAETIHLAPNTVMVQIKQLENHLGVKLFSRSSKGESLTSAGEFLYKESTRLLEASDYITSQILLREREEKPTINIGVMPLDPLQTFCRIWRCSSHCRDYHINLINLPSSVNSQAVKHMMGNMDICFSPESFTYESINYKALPFCKNALTLSVPMSHRLSYKRSIPVEELKGERILFPARGNSGMAEHFAEAMKKYDVIVDTPSLFYDIELFNYCDKENRLLVSIDDWNEVHPRMINIPVASWDWTIQCSLAWREDAQQVVLNFVDAFKEGLEKGNH